jgi:hypothetical protein
MKYVVEIGSGAMTYLPSFINMGDLETHRQHGDRTGLLSFLSK